MRPPQDCSTMAELRAEIDRVDVALLRLFAERARYIDRAAEIKAVVGLPARIEARVEQVVANVRQHAEVEGVSPDLAEKLWRKMIEWSITREEASLGKDA